MSTPPIFSVQPSGTLAQQYLHRGRMFRQAALDLPDYWNGEQNWPRYAMLTHAIELALKAFALHAGHDMEGKRPANHDLSGWYHLALGYGLPVNATVGLHIDVLNELHANHYLRYPQQTRRLPAVHNIADDTVEWLLDTCAPVINRP